MIDSNSAVIKKSHWLGNFQWFRRRHGGHWELWRYYDELNCWHKWFCFLNASRSVSYKPADFHNTTVLVIEDWD